MEKSSNAPVAKSNRWDPLRDTNETVLMITAQKQKKFSGSESSHFLKGGYKIDVENCDYAKSPMLDGLVDIISLPIHSKDSYLTAELGMLRLPDLLPDFPPLAGLAFRSNERVEARPFPPPVPFLPLPGLDLALGHFD
jgi:hypothetical protein